MIKTELEDDDNNSIELKECAQACVDDRTSCNKEDCMHWIKFGEDHNCDLVSIKKHGPLTLRQVGERLGVSYVRIKQIEDAALKKIRESTTLEMLEN